MLANVLQGEMKVAHVGWTQSRRRKSCLKVAKRGGSLLAGIAGCNGLAVVVNRRSCCIVETVCGDAAHAVRSRAADNRNSIEFDRGLWKREVPGANHNVCRPLRRKLLVEDRPIDGDVARE